MARAPTARISREEQKGRTRAAITYAARGLFMAQGYGTTSVDAIAKAAKVSRATFYLHFRSKSEIVLELMRDLEPEITAAYDHLGAIQNPTPEAVEAWLRRHADLWRRHTMEFTAMEQALANEPQVADEWLQLYAKLGAKTVDARGEAAGVQRERALSRLLTIVMAIDRSFYFTVIRRHDDIFEIAARELADLLSQALTVSRDSAGF